jgi:hypothetical protein
LHTHKTISEVEDEVVAAAFEHRAIEVDPQPHRRVRDCALGDGALLIRRELSGYVLILENEPDELVPD